MDIYQLSDFVDIGDAAAILRNIISEEGLNLLDEELNLLDEEDCDE